MELNREQVIAALECCTRGRKSKEDRPCLDCPYNECNLVGGTSEMQIKGTCQGWLMKDALSLIKELTVELEAMEGTANSYKRLSVDLAKQVGSLKDELAKRPKPLIITKLPKKKK